MLTDIVSTLSNKKRIFVFIFASTILLYFIFAPAVSVLYYGGDDYRYAFGGYHKACKTDDGFEYMLTLGRPVQAYLDCLSYKFAFTLERMRVVRFLAVVLMGCAMGLLIDWLYSLGISIGIAFFAAGCLFLVQQVYLDTMMMGALSLPLPLVLVLLAIRSQWRILSAIFLLIALLSYPAMAFFFPTLVLAKVLFSKLSDWEKTRREAFYNIVLFIFVCAIYFIWAYYNMHYHARTPISEAYQLDHPNLNMVDVFRRFLFLGNVFNPLWMLSTSTDILLQGWVMTIAILGGCFFGMIFFLKSNFFRQNKFTALTNLGQTILLVMILLALSSTFFLVMPSLKVIQTRILFGILASGIILVLWSLSCWSTIFPRYLRKSFMLIMVGFSFLIQAQEANTTMLTIALSHSKYLNEDIHDIQNFLADGKKLERIHFIIPQSNYPYDRFFMANAALMQVLGAKNYKIHWCSLPRGNSELEKNHQAEAMTCIKNSAGKAVAITYSYENESYPKTNSMLVIKNHYEPIDLTV